VKAQRHREAVVQYWWAKAEESLKSAERELAASSFNFGMNRIYYAAFYAVSAVLLKRQISFKKHSAARSAFHREFIKPGLPDVKWGKFYDRLFEDRQEGDYLALVELESGYVKDKLNSCKKIPFCYKRKISDLKK